MGRQMPEGGDCSSQGFQDVRWLVGQTMMSRRLPVAETACIPFSNFSTATGERYMTRPSRSQQVGTSGSNPLAMSPSAQFWFSRSTEQVV